MSSIIIWLLIGIVITVSVLIYVVIEGVRTEPLESILTDL